MASVGETSAEFWRKKRVRRASLNIADANPRHIDNQIDGDNNNLNAAIVTVPRGDDGEQEDEYISGWLRKKCKRSHRRWVRRFFSLDTLSRTLRYSKNRFDPRDLQRTSLKVRTFLLDGYSVHDRAHAKREKRMQYLHHFVLSHPSNRSWQLAADSEVEKIMWMKGLNRALLHKVSISSPRPIDTTQSFPEIVSSTIAIPNSSLPDGQERDDGGNTYGQDEKGDDSTLEGTPQPEKTDGIRLREDPPEIPSPEFKDFEGEIVQPERETTGSSFDTGSDGETKHGMEELEEEAKRSSQKASRKKHAREEAKRAEAAKEIGGEEETTQWHSIINVEE